MTITLREITMVNFRECLSLKLAPGQEDFVASNMFSLAEAKADGVSEPLAIYSDETMVGFTMYWYDENNRRGFIDRLMVDHRFQGKGYGREAMIEVIRRLKQKPGINQIQILVRSCQYRRRYALCQPRLPQKRRGHPGLRGDNRHPRSIIILDLAYLPGSPRGHPFRVTASRWR